MILAQSLDGEDLVGANLQQADLRAASLVEADLTGIRLQHASLVRAHLARACLRWARLARAHLHGANLHESVVGSTLFGRTHLRGARGLATCQHQAPSPLDMGTYICSGRLPADFLRGCGWSDAQIASLAGHLQEPPVLACIERALALPPIDQRAGLWLLASVSTVLRQQHPHLHLRYHLAHSGPMIRLLVETPGEARETVERTLQTYGGVMAEHQPPAAWRVDPAQLHHLRQHLEGASTALRMPHDIEPSEVSLPLTGVERLRRLRHLVGTTLHDL